MKKYLVPAFLFSILYFLLSPVTALAFCPVCTVAVAAGVGLSRWLGVDDTISGLWVGGLTVSMIAWTINWLKGKNISRWYYSVIIVVAYYAMILIPFYKTDIISFHPSNLIWGIDKLVVGIVSGSLFFLLSHSAYLMVKEKNGGHAHFPFEKIVFPVGTLIILTAVFYFLTRVK